MAEYQELSRKTRRVPVCGRIIANRDPPGLQVPGVRQNREHMPFSIGYCARALVMTVVLVMTMVTESRPRPAIVFPSSLSAARWLQMPSRKIGRHRPAAGHGFGSHGAVLYQDRAIAILDGMRYRAPVCIAKRDIAGNALYQRVRHARRYAYIGLQIKILGCVISRAISTRYRTYDLFDGAPSSLAKITI